MPWCDDCSKFWNPPQLSTGATCPTCGRPLLEGARKAAVPEAGDPEAETVEALGPAAAATGPSAQKAPPGQANGAPWHFKLLVVGVTVYMVYRIYWLIEWLPKHV